jgi:mRNA interferase RelE/StbE
MNTYFDSKFKKKISKIRDKNLAKRIENVIIDVTNAQSLSELTNVKKLTGHTDMFRIRLGDYRIGIQLISSQSVEFLDIDKRNDFYKSFP